MVGKGRAFGFFGFYLGSFGSEEEGIFFSGGSREFFSCS